MIFKIHVFEVEINNKGISCQGYVNIKISWNEGE